MLLSWGNQACPLSASALQVGLRFHLGGPCDLPEDRMIDSRMAICDSMRIKDTRRQFLNFWNVDLMLKKKKMFAKILCL